MKQLDILEACLECKKQLINSRIISENNISISYRGITPALQHSQSENAGKLLCMLISQLVPKYYGQCLSIQIESQKTAICIHFGLQKRKNCKATDAFSSHIHSIMNNTIFMKHFEDLNIQLSYKGEKLDVRFNHMQQSDYHGKLINTDDLFESINDKENALFLCKKYLDRFTYLSEMINTIEVPETQIKHIKEIAAGSVTIHAEKLAQTAFRIIAPAKERNVSYTEVQELKDCLKETREFLFNFLQE